MNTIKPVVKKEIIDLDKYANIETGEELSSELSNSKSTITVIKETGLHEISSDDYAVIDSDAVIFLMQILNNSDLANVLKMAIVTKTPLNIVFNENIPHTNETLQRYLEIKSESKYMQLIRRLIKIGILYQIKGRIYGEVRVCYMLNPYLTRKRKKFESKVFEVFEQFKTCNTMC